MKMEYCKNISLSIFICPTIFDHIISFCLPYEMYVAIKVIDYQTLGYIFWTGSTNLLFIMMNRSSIICLIQRYLIFRHQTFVKLYFKQFKQLTIVHDIFKFNFFMTKGLIDKLQFKMKV